MRYLKTKVARALQRQQNTQDSQTESSYQFIRKGLELETINLEKDSIIKPAILSLENSSDNFQTDFDKSPPKKKTQPNKNIVKNYARAMINFCLSDSAASYLKLLTREENVVLKDFKNFIQKNKKKINSIKTLRGMLLIFETDDKQTTLYKSVFKRICEIFLKFFSVNWIFNSKLDDKRRHLNYRFKILRRVRNPIHFTYLENFDKTS